MLPKRVSCKADAALWLRSMAAMKDLPRGKTLDLFAEDMPTEEPRMPAGEPRHAGASERRAIAPATDVASAWRATATTIRTWLDERGLDRREAVVLVPFVQLIDPLRRA